MIAPKNRFSLQNMWIIIFIACLGGWSAASAFMAGSMLWLQPKSMDVVNEFLSHSAFMPFGLFNQNLWFYFIGNSLLLIICVFISLRLRRHIKTTNAA